MKFTRSFCLGLLGLFLILSLVPMPGHAALAPSEDKLDYVSLSFLSAEGLTYNYTFTGQHSQLGISEGWRLRSVILSYTVNDTEEHRGYISVLKGDTILHEQLTAIYKGNGTLVTKTYFYGYYPDDPAEAALFVADGESAYAVFVAVVHAEDATDHFDPDGSGLYSSVYMGDMETLGEGSTDTWLMGIIWCLIAFLPPILLNFVIPRYGVALGLFLSVLVLVFADGANLWLGFIGVLTIGLILYQSREVE